MTRRHEEASAQLAQPLRPDPERESHPSPVPPPVGLRPVEPRLLPLPTGAVCRDWDRGSEPQAVRLRGLPPEPALTAWAPSFHGVFAAAPCPLPDEEVRPRRAQTAPGPWHRYRCALSPPRRPTAPAPCRRECRSERP